MIFLGGEAGGGGGGFHYSRFQRLARTCNLGRTSSLLMGLLLLRFSNL